MIKEFMGKKIELNDELVKTFEEFMHEKIDDRLIRVYMNASNCDNDISQNELKQIIEQGLRLDLKLMGFNDLKE